MKRSHSRSRSISRRKRHSSRSKYDSPSPDRNYSHRNRDRSSSRGKSRSSRSHFDEVDRYSPGNDAATPPFKVICVSALHGDASDDTIKDIMYSEYKRCGEFTVKVSRNSEERVAYIIFKNAEDAKEAMRSKRRILVYDKVAIVEPVFDKRRHSADRHRDRSSSRSPEYDRHYKRHPPPPASVMEPSRYYERMPPYMPLPYMPPDYRREMLPHPGHDILHMPPMMHHLHHPVYGPRHFLPYPGLPYHTPPMHETPKKFPNYLHHIPPEDDPNATRTLFAGNLDFKTAKEDLQRIFSPYGVIEDVDVKRPASGIGTAYAFVRFKNLDMAHKAKVELSGTFLGKYQMKVGYGKATPTTRIWVGGLGPWTSSVALENEFDRFGAIRKIDYDKDESCAYILYDSIDAATSAVKEMRGFPLGGPEHKLRVDFADVGSYSPYNSDEDNRRINHSNGSNREGVESDVEDRKMHRRSRKERDYEHNKKTCSIESATSLSEIIECCSTTWEGAFVLKNSAFPVRFHLTDGNPDVISKVLDEENTHLLKITQRLHLNPTKLEEVSKQISADDSFAVFLGMPNPKFKIDAASFQTKPMQNLITYLKQKEAAGVLTITQGVIYAFPPCPFSVDLLKRTALKVTEDNLKKDHLIVLVIKG